MPAFIEPGMLKRPSCAKRPQYWPNFDILIAGPEVVAERRHREELRLAGDGAGRQAERLRHPGWIAGHRVLPIGAEERQRERVAAVDEDAGGGVRVGVERFERERRRRAGHGL